MFESVSIDPRSIASVTIGTTHFVNAVVTRDSTRLSTVAVLRLSSAYSKYVPPCLDWPASLRNIVLGHYALVKGGLEVDGSLISDIKEQEIVEQCRIIKEKKIQSIVINGVFSPIDTIEKQEELAAEIVKRELGEQVDIVLSKTVANLGFIERENAAILNASILSFARKTIASFQDPIRRLGLNCPVFITQNDGTILSGEAASRLPIRTFSSGPTNSMRGAAYLIGQKLNEAIMVVDMGGTTTDVGLLLANGFPRQQAAYSELSGVRMNFSYPDVKSIGLGGGSLVRRLDGQLRVGPESVGYQLPEKALVFGGAVPTATDYTVAASSEVRIGDTDKVRGKVQETDIQDFKKEVQDMLERIIDTMKTAPEDIPVLLVGGGAVIAPDSLRGASRVLKPQWSGVANAIGAAMARVSALVDTVKSTETHTSKEILADICEEAKQKTIEAGALADSVTIVEVEDLPLQYVANKSRFIVRAAGDFDFSRASDFTDLNVTRDGEVSSAFEEDATKDDIAIPSDDVPPVEDQTLLEVDIVTYKPKVINREWWISETDLNWISTGCYILGTGGGGSPYSTMLRVRGILRAGGKVRVISPDDLRDDDRVGCGGGAGSPTVGIERLPADEMMDAQTHLYELYKGGAATHIIPLEIGGMNGLQGLVLGASTNMNIPCVDADWMGRAYPTKWQTTPVVFGEREIVFAPVAVADGNGNTLYMGSATSDLKVEQVIRAALSQMGSGVGTADAPVTGAETRRWAVEHTISLSWRIGREVARARKENRIENVAEAIIDAVGGSDTGRVLFKGKIVGVERRLYMGHVYGEVVIEGADAKYHGRIKVPFKNENIAAIHIPQSGETKAGEEKNEDVLAIAPDLVAVIDAQNGEAIGTPEYRYGLLVSVIGITASERWTSPRGVELGGPNAFGLHHLDYRPLGKFVKPVSVIDEYDGQA